MALNAAFLLDDDRSTEFLELVTATRERYPSLEIKVNGPWPPYSFSVLEEL
jgi:hypothetical protein